MMTDNVKEWFRLTDFSASRMLQDEIDKVKKSEPKLSRYETTGHTNCKYCRKCKLFKINKCWEKSPSEQMNCIHYGSKYATKCNN